MRGPLRLLQALLLALALTPELARAQASADGDRAAAAEALFVAGRQAMKAGDYATACAKFRESNRLEAGSGTMLNLAICEEHRGRLAIAWELLRSVLRILPPDDSRQALVRQQAAALEQRVPRVVLSAKSPLPRDMVVIHGQSQFTASSFDVPIPVDPGEHVFVVRAAGTVPQSYRVWLKEGESLRLMIAAGPAVLAPSTTAARAERRRARERQWTYGVISLGIAGSAFIAAGVSGLLVLREQAIVDDRSHCDANGACDAAGVGAASAGKRFLLVSNVALATGLVASGVGAYLLLSRPTEREASARSRAGSALYLRVTLPSGNGPTIGAELRSDIF